MYSREESEAVKEFLRISSHDFNYVFIRQIAKSLKTSEAGEGRSVLTLHTKWKLTIIDIQPFVLAEEKRD